MATTAERARFSIDLPENWHDYLGQLAKTHKLTQGEIVEALLANMHKCVGVEDDFRARATEKRTARQTARVKATFDKMTPEEKVTALALLQAQPAAA